MTLSEADVEAAALGWFEEMGYAVLAGSQLDPGKPSAERQAVSDVVLAKRLRAAIQRLNPAIPEQAREEALRKLLRLATPSCPQTNRAFHRLQR
ncbi:MAG: type I restriction endonuclease, partial [Cyanobacteriota bacterium]